MSKTALIEQRASERHGLNVRLTYELSAELVSGGKKEIGKAVNISSVGILIVTKKPLKPFQIVRISIPVPDVKVVSPTLAEVRWVNENKKRRGEFLVGLVFLL